MARPRESPAIGFLVIPVVLVVGLLLTEFVLFRYVAPGTDIPAPAFANDVMKHAPNQEGVYRLRNEIAAPFHFNAQGWNSGHADYAVAKPPGALRVAVIGDALVEALQVPHDKSLAEQLEALPGKVPVQAFRFGMDGAPFSQQVWVMDREVLDYRPDVVAMVLSHADLHESYEPVGLYSQSFMKLGVTTKAVFAEIAPVAYAGGTGDWPMRLATMRFLRGRWQVSSASLSASFTGLFGRGASRADTETAASPRYDANVDIDFALSQPAVLTATIDYLVNRLATRARSKLFRALIVMDGVRQAIYAGRDSRALALNRQVGEAAARHGVGFIDLHRLFAEDWRRNHRRFEFASDRHWNDYAHRLVAQAIRRWIDR
jgi:hypothetical protein